MCAKVIYRPIVKLKGYQQTVDKFFSAFSLLFACKQDQNHLTEQALSRKHIAGL